ncbi:MAG: hypothetical protein NC930_07380 [Candidatus Omnitrophica bacterium]|nr:hypothetical protein [Candidatus Omnitrophota bacterium]
MTYDWDFEISFYERLVKEKPLFVDALIPLAEAYTRKGLYRKGLKVDKLLSKLCKDDPIIHYNLACSYALLGHKKSALRALAEAIRLGYRDLGYLRRDPDLKNLHQDSKFQKLVANLK